MAFTDTGIKKEDDDGSISSSSTSSSSSSDEDSTAEQLKRMEEKLKRNREQRQQDDDDDSSTASDLDSLGSEVYKAVDASIKRHCAPSSSPMSSSSSSSSSSSDSDDSSMAEVVAEDKKPPVDIKVEVQLGENAATKDASSAMHRNEQLHMENVNRSGPTTTFTRAPPLPANKIARPTAAKPVVSRERSSHLAKEDVEEKRSSTVKEPTTSSSAGYSSSSSNSSLVASGSRPPSSFVPRETSTPLHNTTPKPSASTTHGIGMTSTALTSKKKTPSYTTNPYKKTPDTVAAAATAFNPYRSSSTSFKQQRMIKTPPPSTAVSDSSPNESPLLTPHPPTPSPPKPSDGRGVPQLGAAKTATKQQYATTKYTEQTTRSDGMEGTAHAQGNIVTQQFFDLLDTEDSDAKSDDDDYAMLFDCESGSSGQQRDVKSCGKDAQVETARSNFFQQSGATGPSNESTNDIARAGSALTTGQRVSGLVEERGKTTTENPEGNDGIINYAAKLSIKKPEIDPSLYAPPTHVLGPEPIVHVFNMRNRPSHMRKKIPVTKLFPSPINKLWTSKFQTFNHLQSEVVNVLAHSNDNFLISSPTGSGKSTIFDIVMARLIHNDLMSQPKATQQQPKLSMRRKMVYVAPSKALCEERHADWNHRLEALNLGIIVRMITGDGDPKDAFNQLKEAHLIVTTPEKFDSMSRRWTEQFYLFASIKLFMVDEVHVVGDPSRGSCLETIICRMKSIQRAAGRVKVSSEELLSSDSSYPQTTPEAIASSTRIIAVSATLPNIQDCAALISASECYTFDHSYRPVPLTTEVVGLGNIKKNEFQFWSFIDRRIPEIIHIYSKKKPTIVFCHSKKDTEKLAEMLTQSPGIGGMTRPSDTSINGAKNRMLKGFLLRGIAFHHAGLDIDDRRTIEKAFAENKIRVICATSTLAVGVNLPVHLVIIKGTRAWRGGGSGYQDIDTASILQMTGRAGRPGFDDSGVAVIMTDNASKSRYENLRGLGPVESQLEGKLIEVLNSEIAQKVICSTESALNWIKTTMYYTQVRKHPTRFGLSDNSSRSIDEFLLRQLEQRLQKLNEMRFINENANGILPLLTSQIMSSNLVDLQAWELMVGLPFDASTKQVLWAICQIEDLQRPVRRSEKAKLNDVHKTVVKYKLEGQPSKVRVQTPEQKAFVLLQAHIGHHQFEDYTLKQETSAMIEYSSRMLSALEEYSGRGSLNGHVAVQSFKLKRSIEKKSKFLNEFDANSLTAGNLRMHGIVSFQHVLDSTDEELDKALQGATLRGFQLRSNVEKIMKSSLKLSASIKYRDNGLPPYIICNLEGQSSSSELTYTLVAYTDKPGCLWYEKAVTKPNVWEFECPERFGLVVIQLLASNVGGLDQKVELKGNDRIQPTAYTRNHATSSGLHEDGRSTAKRQSKIRNLISENTLSTTSKLSSKTKKTSEDVGTAAKRRKLQEKENDPGPTTSTPKPQSQIPPCFQRKQPALPPKTGENEPGQKGSTQTGANWDGASGDRRPAAETAMTSSELANSKPESTPANTSPYFGSHQSRAPSSSMPYQQPGMLPSTATPRGLSELAKDKPEATPITSPYFGSHQNRGPSSASLSLPRPGVPPSTETARESSSLTSHPRTDSTPPTTSPYWGSHQNRAPPAGMSLQRPGMPHRDSHGRSTTSTQGHFASMPSESPSQNRWANHQTQPAMAQPRMNSGGPGGLQGMPQYSQPMARSSQGHAQGRQLETMIALPHGRRQSSSNNGFSRPEQRAQPPGRTPQRDSRSSLSPRAIGSANSRRSNGSWKSDGKQDKASKSWQQEKRAASKSQQRAFTKKKENPFSHLKHDPNDAEGFLDNLNSANSEPRESSIIPQSELQALRQESAMQRPAGLITKRFVRDGRAGRKRMSRVFPSQRIPERDLLAMKAAEAQANATSFNNVVSRRQVSPVPHRRQSTNRSEYSVTPGNLSIVTTDHDHYLRQAASAPQHMYSQAYDQAAPYEAEYMEDNGFEDNGPWDDTQQWGQYGGDQWNGNEGQNGHMLEPSMQPGMDAFDGFSPPAYDEYQPQQGGFTVGNHLTPFQDPVAFHETGRYGAPASTFQSGAPMMANYATQHQHPVQQHNDANWHPNHSSGYGGALSNELEDEFFS